MDIHNDKLLQATLAICVIFSGLLLPQTAVAETLDPLGPRALKADAVNVLESAYTGDRRVDRTVKRVIGYINKSLSGHYWIDDYHLNRQRGHQVFNAELKAVASLVFYSQRWQRGGPSQSQQHAIDVFNVVNPLLVEADRLLAETALDEANATLEPSKRRQLRAYKRALRAANSAYLRGLRLADKDRSVLAVLYFRHSWVFAQRAIKLAPEPVPTPEVCDGLDNDLDGLVDEDFNVGDSCSAGIGACLATGTLSCSADGSGTQCSAVAGTPSAEICDGLDNNCDGQIDELVTSTFYADLDNDGFGDSANTVLACSAPPGYVADDTDCNDANAGVNPGAEEVCDRLDNDCDGELDEFATSTFYRDQDGDLFGDVSDSIEACSAPPGYVMDNSDCNDADATANPAAAEICSDSVDNDCDGQVDSQDADCQICGNGILDPFEQCDDGNLIDGDECSSSCEIEVITCNGVASDADDVCGGNGDCVGDPSQPPGQGVCDCYADYSGENCDQFTGLSCGGVAAGDSLVCSGRGVCEDQDVCVCDAGYLGDLCETELMCSGVPATSPDVCSARGECQNDGSCLCDPNFSGPDCSEFVGFFCDGISSMDPTVCSGNGVCTAEDTCVCTEGFQGTNCELIAASCTPDCGSNGSCVAPDVCDCAEGWTGLACDVPVALSCFGTDATNPMVCSGNGQCIAEDKCLCNPGFSGSVCQQDSPVTCGGIPNHFDQVCSGNGVCTQQDSCNCYAGFAGDDCEEQIIPTCLPAANGLVCSGHGECIDNKVCKCEPQYSGDDCGLREWNCFGGPLVYAENEQSACENGTCTYQDNCQCDAGWGGSKCDIINDLLTFCAGVPQSDPTVCSGRGDCTVNGTCECLDGYYGPACEQVLTCGPYDAFDPKVCSENGQCIEVFDGLSACECDAGFTGTYCETLLQ